MSPSPLNCLPGTGPIRCGGLIAGALCCATFATSGELPNATLLPVTRRIHQQIAASDGPRDPAKLERYAEKVPRAGDSAIEMVPLPAGSFLLGSPAGESGRADDEGPQRKVSVGAFWIGRTEITWGAYRAFMENDKPRNLDGTINRDADKVTSEAPELLEGESLPEIVSQPTPPYTPMHYGMGDGYGAEYPALGMTQHAASKFCEWLSAQTGHFYRLPTEAEWKAQDRQMPKSIWYLTDAVWIGFRVVRPLETPDLETMHLYWNTGPGPGTD